MNQPEIRRQLVWSKALRWCHWGMALSVLALLASGWLITWVPEKAERVRELHYLGAAVLIAVLAVRMWLLAFGKGNEALNKLLPNKHQLGQSWQVLRSYLSLGKIPLPKWYAHNPLWSPLYLLLFLILLIQIGSGLALLNEVTLFGSLSVRQAHSLGFQIIALFTLLHILASFFHDSNSTTSDISAMINGHRIFIIEPRQQQTFTTDTIVSLHSSKKENKKA